MNEFMIFFVICLSLLCSSILSGIGIYFYLKDTKNGADQPQMRKPGSSSQTSRFPSQASRFPKQASRFSSQESRFPSQASRFPSQASRFPSQAPRFPNKNLSTYSPPNQVTNHIIDYSDDIAFKKHQQQITQIQNQLKVMNQINEAQLKSSQNRLVYEQMDMPHSHTSDVISYPRYTAKIHDDISTPASTISPASTTPPASTTSPASTTPPASTTSPVSTTAAPTPAPTTAAPTPAPTTAAPTPAPTPAPSMDHVKMLQWVLKSNNGNVEFHSSFAESKQYKFHAMTFETPVPNSLVKLFSSRDDPLITIDSKFVKASCDNNSKTVEAPHTSSSPQMVKVIVASYMGIMDKNDTQVYIKPENSSEWKMTSGSSGWWHGATKAEVEVSKEAQNFTWYRDILESESPTNEDKNRLENFVKKLTTL